MKVTKLKGQDLKRQSRKCQRAMRWRETMLGAWFADRGSHETSNLTIGKMIKARDLLRANDVEVESVPRESRR